MEPVVFMLRGGLVEFGELERHFQAVQPLVAQADIAPGEFRAYFEEIRRRIAK